MADIDEKPIKEIFKDVPVKDAVDPHPDKAEGSFEKTRPDWYK